MRYHLLLSIVFLAGCSGLEDSEKQRIKKMNATGEYIYRTHGEFLFPIEEPKRHIRDNYPWEDTYVGSHIKITKEFFRCKGNGNNPPITRNVNAQPTLISDCGGPKQHSLPLHDGKEFIYPALIDLLNHIQEKTGKKVVITCGYRCPKHSAYCDSSKFNQTSKHMIGAEVDFYVKGLEWSPEKIVPIIMKYYENHPKHSSDTKWTNFHRYEQETNVSTLPWYNKEIFVKLFKKDEGRDLDNNHRFPYLCIQVKWDRDKDTPVKYNWSDAFNGYLRY